MLNKKLFFYVCMVFLFASFQAFSYIYYIPHIHTGSDAWETYLIFDNISPGDLEATAYYYDENGNVITKEVYTIHASGNKVVMLRPIGAIAAKVYTSSSFIRVRLGYIAKEDLGGGTAEFSPETRLYRYMIMNPSNYYEDLTWSGFALWNATGESVNITLTAFSEEGELAQKDVEMQPYQKIVDFFDNFFELANFKDITSVVIEADKEALTGVVISGKENDKLLFAPPRGIKNFVSHREIIDGYAYNTDIVLTRHNHRLHSFILTEQSITPKNKGKGSINCYHTSWQPFGGSDSFFAEPVNYNIQIKHLEPAESEDAFYIFGIKGSEFVVKKLDENGSENNGWEATFGEAGYRVSFIYNPMDVKISGCEAEGKVFAFVKDKGHNWKGGIVKIDSSDGTVEEEHYLITDNSQLGDMISFKWNNQTRILYDFTYYSYKINCTILDTDLNVVKQIFGDSPLPDSTNKEHQIFCTKVFDDRIFMVIGKEITIEQGWARYHLYLVSVSLDDNDFSNATITDLNTFLTYGSKCFMDFEAILNKNTKVVSGYRIQIITSPEPVLDPDGTSLNIVVFTDDNAIPNNYISLRKRIQYRINGLIHYSDGIYFIGSKRIFADDINSFKTEFMLKYLYYDDIFND